jgi:hypothetical protein
VNFGAVQLNLVFAWVWILAGFLSGMVMGLCFHQENWLGGYASYKRRMYRLGHISFFGLGIVNFIFYLTIQTRGSAGALAHAASWCFVLGGLTMPICCWFMARTARAQFFFGIPVISLIGGAVLTIMEVVL